MADNIRAFVPRHVSARLPEDDAALQASNMAEEALLGSIVVCGDVWDDVQAVGLTAQDFYRQRHRVIWEAMCELAKAKQAIDILTVCQRLMLTAKLQEVGGIAYLQDLTNKYTTGAYADTYARQVLDHSQRRTIGHLTTEATFALRDAGSASEVVGDLMRKLGEVQARASRRLTVKQGLRSLADRAADAESGVVRAPCLPTGIEALDALLGGGPFVGEYVVIAGNSSNGKSIWGKHFAIASQAPRGVDDAGPGWWCDYYSTELGDQAKFDAIVGQTAGFRMREFFGDLRAKGESNHHGALIDAASRMGKWDLEIESGREVTAAHICARARQRARCEAQRAMEQGREPRRGLVIVDYLQALNLDEYGSKGKPEALKAASGLLSDLAHTEGLLVIVTAQAPSECAKQKRAPGPLEVEWSSGVWQDADMSLATFYPYAYDKTRHPHELQAHVTKSREGTTGCALVRFHTELGGELRDPGSWQPPIPREEPARPRQRKGF
jgi:replicative DNA helicase